MGVDKGLQILTSGSSNERSSRGACRPARSQGLAGTWVYRAPTEAPAAQKAQWDENALARLLGIETAEVRCVLPQAGYAQSPDELWRPGEGLDAVARRAKLDAIVEDAENDTPSLARLSRWIVGVRAAKCRQLGFGLRTPRKRVPATGHGTVGCDLGALGHRR
jgi:hypothetical protein